MTAGALDTDMAVTCYWFDADENNFSATFNPLALMTQEEDKSLPGPDFGDYAERAYMAYGEKAKWKNFQGNPMPKWAELPENIRTCWTAAAAKIIEDCNTKYNTR